MVVLDNPCKLLCTNAPAPRNSPFDTAFPTSKGLYSLVETPNEYIDKVMSLAKDEPSISQVAEWFAKAEMEEWLVNQSLSDTPVDLSLPSPYLPDNNIDAKSFTQRLFNSLEWRLRHVLQTLPNSRLSQPKHQLAKCDDRDLTKKAILEAIEDGKRTSNTTKIPQEALDFQMFLEKNRTITYQLCLDAMQLPGRRMQPNFKSWQSRAKYLKNLSIILSDPSKLIFHVSSRSPSSSMLSWLPVDESTRRLKFFSLKSSQPLSFLCMDLKNLEGHPHIESNCHLQWLTSSVKTTYLDPVSVYNIPSSAAANIIAFAIAALVASVRKSNQFIHASLWDHFESFRQKGRIQCGMNHDHNFRSLIDDANGVLAGWVLAYEEPTAQSLMKLVLRSFASWSYASSHLDKPDQANISADATRNGTEIQESCCDFKDRLLDFLAPVSSIASLSPNLTPTLIEWARTIFLREWNGEARFRWDSDVGAAIEFINWLYTHRVELEIEARQFEIDVLIDRMDYVEACRDWLEFKVTPLTGHLLSLPWIMTTDNKFTMFRSISLCKMFAAYESAETMSTMVRRMTQHVKPSARQLFHRLSTSMETFLVLDIRRDNILRDSFNQLWRRQKRELFKPLKVKMGMNEGEEGFDMGGVQQEFFRLAIADGLDPVHGLFAVDEKTRMTWFQPLPTAPLHQFTLIGLLFGLAIYNGITLPVTFPLAFYRKLLGIENSELKHIEDGWPELHSGLGHLLTWSDGKVEDVFLRSYIFSFEALGVVHHIDMLKHTRDKPWTLEPDTSNEDEAEMVTNDNRIQYVKDYIYWLTEKSIAVQFEAFKTGFNLPLHKKALLLLSPRDLRTLLEGHQAIDIEGLKRTAQYEDKFDANHPRIKEFWEIVQDMTEDQHRKLLEFVTASPRVPARGIDDVLFTIQRNGVGDEHLPTSFTCFGRLLLPEYSSKEIMAEKLKLAIENSTGFGTQ